MKKDEYNKLIKNVSIVGQPYYCDQRPENEHENLLFLYDYWHSKCTELKRIPKYTDIDLTDLFKVIKCVFIVELDGNLDASARYSYRYYGTAVREFSKMEMTGRYLDEIYSIEAAQELTELFNDLLETSKPHVSRRRINFTGDVPTVNEYSRVMVPYLDEDELPRYLMGVMAFH